MPILSVSLIIIVFYAILYFVGLYNFSEKLSEDHVSAYHNREITLYGVSTSNYTRTSSGWTVELDVIGVIEDNYVDASGKILTYLPGYLEYDIGEILLIKGKIDAPKDFTEDFSYVEYLSRKGIYSIVYSPYVEKTGKYRINAFLKAIYEVRESIISKFERYLPEPHSSLLSGIVLGVGNTMPKGFSDALRSTGTTHIIAASGYNVAVVSNFIVSSLKFLNRKIRYIVAIGFVWIFVVVSGGSIPVLRAAIMGTITMISMFLGRKSNIIQSLAFSVIVILLLDRYALESISFQLSFASTIGLIWIVPLLKRLLFFVPESLEESFIVSLAAIISTFPITVGNFGTFSVVSLIANMLIIPTVEVLMILGCTFMVVPRCLTFVLKFIGSILWVILEYFISIVEFLADISFSSIKINSFGLFHAVIWYVIIIFLVIYFKPKTYEKYC
jgi:competence protein ComEC